MKTCIN